MPLRAFAAKHSFSFFPSEEPGCGKSGKNEKIKKCYLIISEARIWSQKSSGTSSSFQFSRAQKAPMPCSPASPHALCSCKGTACCQLLTGDRSRMRLARTPEGPLSVVNNCPGLIFTLPPLFPSPIYSICFRLNSNFQRKTKAKEKSEKNHFPSGGDPHLDDDGALPEQLI